MPARRTETGCRRSRGTWRSLPWSRRRAGPIAMTRAHLGRQPARSSVGGPPSTPGGSRTSRPANGGVGARPTPGGEPRPRRASAATRPGRRGRPPVRHRRLWPRCGSRPAGARRARASAGAARRTGFVRAHGRRPAAHRRRARGPGGARGWAARHVPRPITSARSCETRPPIRATRDRIGWPSRHASPPPSPAGSRPGRLRPRCPSGGTARTTAVANRSRRRRSCDPSRDRQPGAS